MTEQRIKFNFELPTDIVTIKDIFKAEGFKLFVVGGAVRDAVLGKEPKDFDLATDAIPDKVEEMMRKANFRTLATGKSFGVINVFTDTDEFEVATFRTDIGSGRRPDSVEFTTIEGDVKRRDLTINALFFDIDTSEIVDLVGGLDDLKNGVVKTVGSAEERFGEDRLRILRAIRFAARFGNDLHPDVEAALFKDASLEGVSGERIHDEFVKGIKSAKSVKQFLELIDKFGLFGDIFPKLKISKWFPKINDPITVIAFLLMENDVKTIGRQLNELKFSSDDIKAIEFLLNFKNFDLELVSEFKKQQKRSKLTDQQILWFTTLLGNFEFEFMTKFLEFELSITGDFVMKKFGIEAGPELGIKIAELEKENFLKLVS
jgi:tRNA nucleotidyltransferase/poly(A) polymerase